MRLTLLACLLLSFVGVLPQTALAEIFKCKAANGKVTYSESPCEGVTSEEVKVIDNTSDSASLRRQAQGSSRAEESSSSASTSSSTPAAPARNVRSTMHGSY